MDYCNDCGGIVVIAALTLSTLCLLCVLAYVLKRRRSSVISFAVSDGSTSDEIWDFQGVKSPAEEEEITSHVGSGGSRKSLPSRFLRASIGGRDDLGAMVLLDGTTHTDKETAGGFYYLATPRTGVPSTVIAESVTSSDTFAPAVLHTDRSMTWSELEHRQMEESRRLRDKFTTILSVSDDADSRRTGACSLSDRTPPDPPRRWSATGPIPSFRRHSCHTASEVHCKASVASASLSSELSASLLPVRRPLRGSSAPGAGRTPRVSALSEDRDASLSNSWNNSYVISSDMEQALSNVEQALSSTASPQRAPS